MDRDHRVFEFPFRCHQCSVKFFISWIGKRICPGELSTCQLNLTKIETIYDSIEKERPTRVKVNFILLFAMSHDVKVAPLLELALGSAGMYVRVPTEKLI